jgi:hypothetical protein
LAGFQVSINGRFWVLTEATRNLLLVRAVQRMAAKLRPRMMLPRCVSSEAARAAEARGRQLQRLVSRQKG